MKLSVEVKNDSPCVRRICLFIYPNQYKNIAINRINNIIAYTKSRIRNVETIRLDGGAWMTYRAQI